MVRPVIRCGKRLHQAGDCEACGLLVPLPPARIARVPWWRRLRAWWRTRRVRRFDDGVCTDTTCRYGDICPHGDHVRVPIPPYAGGGHVDVPVRPFVWVRSPRTPNDAVPITRLPIPGDGTPRS